MPSGADTASSPPPRAARAGSMDSTGGLPPTGGFGTRKRAGSKNDPVARIAASASNASRRGQPVSRGSRGSFDSDDTTPNGLTTSSQGSESPYSHLTESEGERTPASQASLMRERPPQRSRKRLTDEERDLFMRIEREWREEDAWATQPAGTLSTIIWTPILIGLRCFNIWLSVVTWPLSFIARYIFGHQTKTISFWDVPLERRKQTIAVASFVMLLPFIFVAYTTSLILLLFPLTTLPMLAYYLFIVYWDKSAENGSRRPFIRYWKLWRHFANYFPLRLIKTANLDPNRKYVFAYHPHGIISVGAFGNFATNATGFSRKFPGIDLRLLTLEMNFWCPWIREVLLSMGLCSASKRSCNQILARGPGSAIMLVVGGAAESLDTEPGTYRLTLGRKGFVRVALDNGADLVPVLGFGENDIFDTMYYPPNTWARKLQEKMRKRLGFATPIFYGRGLFNYSLGVMPHRKPIIVVVGKPIKLPKLPPHLRGAALSTTEEGVALVDKYHHIYVEALRDIWDMYKSRWAVHRAGSLLIQGGNHNKHAQHGPGSSSKDQQPQHAKPSAHNAARPKRSPLAANPGAGKPSSATMAH